MKKIALIIGNGKSTELLYDYGFHNIPDYIDTYSTSLAFRYCDKLNWQPTFYCFADPKSVFHQKKNIKEKISSYTKTKKWYLCTNMIKKSYFEADDKVVSYKHSGSGPAALEIAINKKIYSKILIIGLDHNYTWNRKLVKFLNNTDNRAEYLCDVKDHPSYFFPYYIKKGDVVSWQMDAKNNTETKHFCHTTQRFIDNATKNNIKIIDFSNNLLKTNKSKNLNEHFTL